MFMFPLLPLLALSSGLSPTWAQSSGTITLTATGSGCVIVAQAATLGTPFVLTKMMAICPKDGKRTINWPFTTAGDGSSSGMLFYSQLSTSGSSSTPGCVLSLSQMQAMYCLGRDLEFRGDAQDIYDNTAGGFLMDPTSFQPIVCGTDAQFLPSGLTLPSPGSGNFDTPVTLVAGGGGGGDNTDTTTKEQPPPVTSSGPPPEPSTSDSPEPTSSTQGKLQGILVTSSSTKISSTQEQESAKTLTKTVTRTSSVTVFQGVQISSSAEPSSSDAASSDTASTSTSSSSSSSSSSSHRSKSRDDPHFAFSTFHLYEFVHSPKPQPSDVDCDCDDSSSYTTTREGGAHTSASPSGKWVVEPVTSSSSQAPITTHSTPPQTSSSSSIASSTSTDTSQTSSSVAPPAPPPSPTTSSNTETSTSWYTSEFVFTQGSTTIGQFQPSGKVPGGGGNDDSLLDVLGLNAKPVVETSTRYGGISSSSTNPPPSISPDLSRPSPPPSTASRSPQPSPSPHNSDSHDDGSAHVEINNHVVIQPSDSHSGQPSPTSRTVDPTSLPKGSDTRPSEPTSKRPDTLPSSHGSAPEKSTAPPPPRPSGTKTSESQPTDNSQVQTGSSVDSDEDVRGTLHAKMRKRQSDHRGLSRMKRGFGGGFGFGGYDYGSGLYGYGGYSTPSSGESPSGDGGSSGGDSKKPCCLKKRTRSRLGRSYRERWSE